MDVSEKLNGGSQQQDCSGFTPDSLLIPYSERSPETNSAAKVTKMRLATNFYRYFFKFIFIKLFGQKFTINIITFKSHIYYFVFK